MANSVKDYIFTMYFGEQPPGSSFLLCFNGVYVCWTCMSRVKHVLPKKDFAFNATWSALGAINQYNLSAKHAKDKKLVKKILLPELAQFCDTEDERSKRSESQGLTFADQATLQMGMAIKQWITREYIEVECARDAMARNKVIVDPAASLKTSLEKEMEGLIWSRDIGILMTTRLFPNFPRKARSLYTSRTRLLGRLDKHEKGERGDFML